MQYKGAYSGDVTYSVGDIVVYTDGVAYHLMKPAPAGTTCHDIRYWNPLVGVLQEVVQIFHTMLSGLAATKAIADEVILDAKTLVLASSTESSTKTYAITVDDEDGLEATEIEEEAEE